MNVGKALKIALVMRGMNQAQLAKKIGTTSVWISRVANKETAGMLTVSKIAAALDMTESKFLALGEG